MRGKLLFVVGLGAGYVIGARAGRSAYDAIVAKAKGTAANPKVQDAIHKAEALAEEKAPQVTSVLQSVAQTATETADAAKQAGTSDPDSAESKPSAAESAAPKPLPGESSAPKPTVPKPAAPEANSTSSTVVGSPAIDEKASSISPEAAGGPSTPTATA